MALFNLTGDWCSYLISVSSSAHRSRRSFSLRRDSVQLGSVETPHTERSHTHTHKPSLSALFIPPGVIGTLVLPHSSRPEHVPHTAQSRTSGVMWSIRSKFYAICSPESHSSNGPVSTIFKLKYIHSIPLPYHASDFTPSLCRGFLWSMGVFISGRVHASHLIFPIRSVDFIHGTLLTDG